MEFIDYYETMGVAETASADDIKRAYRKLARKYHPDVSKEENSEEKFKKVAEAYQVLKEPERRQEYDELRRYGVQGGGQSSGQGYSPPPGWQSQTDFDPGFDPGVYSSDSAGGFSDFFEELFGQRAHSRGADVGSAKFNARGRDLHSQSSISLRDAFNGISLPIEIGRPSVQSDGSIRTSTKTVQVKIPKGIVDGQTIRLRGQGGPAIGDASNGDLYIQLSIAADDVFQLDGRDVSLRLAVTPWESALGATVVVPTLGGDVNLTIPPNSSSGHKLRLKGRGLPGTPPGDQFVVLEMVAPPATTDAQQELYQKMSELWSFNPREKSGSRT